MTSFSRSLQTILRITLDTTSFHKDGLQYGAQLIMDISTGKIDE